MVQFQDSGDARNTFLEVRNLLKVASELDQGCRSESRGVDHKLTMLHGVEITLDQHEVRACLDRQEPSARNVDSMSILEVTDSGTNGSLELND